MADKINKLSHAIRIGRMFRPQAKGTWVGTKINWSLGQDEIQQTTCTAAAAIEALIGAVPKNTQHAALLFANRFDMEVKEASGLISEIINMNDSEGLSSDEIADRLEARGY